VLSRTHAPHIASTSSTDSLPTKEIPPRTSIAKRANSSLLIALVTSILKSYLTRSMWSPSTPVWSISSRDWFFQSFRIRFRDWASVISLGRGVRVMSTRITTRSLVEVKPSLTRLQTRTLTTRLSALSIDISECRLLASNLDRKDNGGRAPTTSPEPPSLHSMLDSFLHAAWHVYLWHSSIS